MNVLFITYDFPYPMNSGGKNRAYHLIKHTAQKANIYLYSFVREDYSPSSNEELIRIGVKDIKVFKRRRLKSFSTIPKVLASNSSIFKSLYFEKEVLADIGRIIKDREIDIIHYESSYTGYYIDEFKSSKVKQVLGTENIEFLLYKNYASSLKPISLKPLVNLQANKLKGEELSMVKNADAVTVITKDEADTLSGLTDVKSSIVANGIESLAFSYNFDKKIKKNILFVGNFTYFPNVDAVNFFYSEVFKKLPNDLTITLIGRKCNEKFTFDDPRIIKKDFVEGIINEYKAADILIFPIRIGGGTNFKALEAMALGVPIVAHPERLAGFKAKDGEHFLAATTGEEYAQKIDLLLNDVKLREKISSNARRLVERNFDWEKIGKDLLNVWEGLV